MVQWNNISEIFETSVSHVMKGILGDSHDIRSNVDVFSENVTKKIWKRQERSPLKLYAIPGNHDMLDGGSIFANLFLEREFIGVWDIDQTRPYFIKDLSEKIVLFGIFDQHLAGANPDIDISQFLYFESFLRNTSSRNIIVASHAPFWYEGTTGVRLQYLIDIAASLNFPIILFLAGDLHFYAHFEPVHGDYPHFVISGGGGAFTHSTHTVTDFNYTINGKSAAYKLRSSYPNSEESISLGRSIIYKNYRNVGMYVLSLVIFIILFLFQYPFSKHSWKDKVLDNSNKQESYGIGFSSLLFNLFAVIILLVILYVITYNFVSAIKITILALFLTYFAITIWAVICFKVMVFQIPNSEKTRGEESSNPEVSLVRRESLETLRIFLEYLANVVLLFYTVEWLELQLNNILNY